MKKALALLLCVLTLCASLAGCAPFNTLIIADTDDAAWNLYELHGVVVGDGFEPEIKDIENVEMALATVRLNEDGTCVVMGLEGKWESDGASVSISYPTTSGSVAGTIYADTYRIFDDDLFLLNVDFEHTLNGITKKYFIDKIEYYYGFSDTYRIANDGNYGGNYEWTIQYDDEKADFGTASPADLSGIERMRLYKNGNCSVYDIEGTWSILNGKLSVTYSQDGVGSGNFTAERFAFLDGDLILFNVSFSLTSTYGSSSGVVPKLVLR